MTLNVGKLEASLPHEPFDAATARVNELRGRCIDAFTRIEISVTECLALMSQLEGRGAQVRLPHLVGQRLEALKAAIAADGPFNREGAVAVDALERCTSYSNLRNMFCHGVCKVTLDPQGRWTIILRLATLRSKRLVREALALSEAEAGELRDKLVCDAKELCAQLSQVRGKLGSA